MSEKCGETRGPLAFKAIGVRITFHARKVQFAK
jgi:hypothetical protein